MGASISLEPQQESVYISSPSSRFSVIRVESLNSSFRSPTLSRDKSFSVSQSAASVSSSAAMKMKKKEKKKIKMLPVCSPSDIPVSAVEKFKELDEHKENEEFRVESLSSVEKGKVLFRGSICVRNEASAFQQLNLVGNIKRTTDGFVYFRFAWNRLAIQLGPGIQGWENRSGSCIESIPITIWTSDNQFVRSGALELIIESVTNELKISEHCSSELSSTEQDSRVFSIDGSMSWRIAQTDEEMSSD